MRITFLLLTLLFSFTLQIHADTLLQCFHDASQKAKLEYTTAKHTFVQIAKDNNIQLSPRDDIINDTIDDDDSDDDLIAYDIVEEDKFSVIGRPMYIRDCMVGLMECDNYEKMDVYLHSLLTLIDRHPLPTKEVSNYLHFQRLPMTQNYMMTLCCFLSRNSTVFIPFI